MLSETEILAKLSSSSHGCVCTFVAIDDNLGIKLWGCDDYNTAKHCHDIQDELASHGLAPKVYQWVEFGDGEYVGYVTERIQTIYELHPIDICDDEAYYALNRKIEPEIEKWCDAAIKACGWEMSDRHLGNFGVSKAGVFMCLDFGNE